ncbi:MAG TPA: DUF4286 family protein [Gemmatimonadales bacterium]|nr:DUF4286 family protein [Gemmatimonadales bacterium]
MIAYVVTVEVEPDLVQAYVAYMQNRHIPDILATGCFSAVEMYLAGPGLFRQRYLAASQADLNRYLADHAPALRFDFQQNFAEGTRVTREVWRELGRWTAPSSL